MAGIRQQRYGTSVDARTGLEDDKQQIENDTDNKGGSRIVRTIMMVVMTMVPLATMMVVMMAAMTVVVVMISHLTQLKYLLEPRTVHEVIVGYALHFSLQ